MTLLPGIVKRMYQQAATAAQDYDTLIMSRSNLLHYWPEIGTDIKGGKDITLTGTTQVEGKVGNARSFNGTSDCGQTAEAIDLTSYEKIVMEWIGKFPSYPHDGLAFEFSPNASSNAGAFYFAPELSGNAVTFLKGDVSYNYANFAQANSNFHHFVAVFDQTLVGYEVKYYIDVIEQTPSGGSTSSNNGTFGNFKMNLGSRDGTSYFCLQTIERLAMYSSITEDEILEDYNKAFL
jgi:hypothetical protein